MPMIPDSDKEFLRDRFDKELGNPVLIAVFVRKAAGLDALGLECQFCRETGELVNELADLSEKITVQDEEFSPDNWLVKELGIDKLPAVVLMNDQGAKVGYYGIPGGFEFKSLVDDIIDVSTNSTTLEPGTRNKVLGLAGDVYIQVFVTPTCPYCPSAVRTAHRMAIENPSHIRADAVEATEFPDLIDRYSITAVPTIVINDRVQFEGVVPEEEFADRVIEALAA
jgi:glutaredoxin-like protein